MNTHLDVSINAADGTLKQSAVSISGTAGDGVVDDTAAILDALTTYQGRVLVGQPGKTYLISQPLIIRSGTTLDMRGATIKLKPGSLCNMLQSQAAYGTGRDSDITVRGGLWDRQNNLGSGSTFNKDANTMVMRKIDGLVMRDLSFASTTGKFGIQVQGTTEFSIKRIRFKNYASDGIHIEGGCARGEVRGIFGTCGDDMVGVTPLNWASQVYGDETDITDLLIDGIFSLGGGASTVAMYGGNGLNLLRVAIKNVFSTGGTPVLVGDSTGSPNTQGGLIDEVDIENVHGYASSPGIPVVSLNATNGKRVAVKNVTWKNGAATQAAVLATNWDSVTVDGVEIVDGGASGGSVVNVNGTVKNLSISNVTGAPGTGFRAVLALDPAFAGASVTRARLNGVQMDFPNGGSFVYAVTAGQVLGTVRLTDCHAVGAAWIADLATATVLFLNGVTHLSDANGVLNLRATSNVTVLGELGAPTQIGVNQTITTAGGYALRVNNRTFPVDISKITSKTGGDMAHNTAAASGTLPGAGPVVWDAVFVAGGRWRLVYAPFTFAGTATLVAGTVAVADTKITGNAKIRVFNQSAGGTVGALSVALNPSTGFTINSTSSSDTSTISYEIVNY